MTRADPLVRVLAIGFVAALAYFALAASAAPAPLAPPRASDAASPPPAPSVAIVVADATPLRAAPHGHATQQALLWSGDVLEVRGERLDHLQVYDHVRERAGFVASARVRRLRLEPGQAPELLAVVRFLRETPGTEALGIGYTAAWLRAASPARVQGPDGAEALEALGAFADRLAQRASSSGTAARSTETALAAHLEVASHHGVRFLSRERDGRVRLCYDGEAHARVLALAATPAQRARAALALTRSECADPDLGPTERRRDDDLRLALLARIDAASLTPTLQARIAMRRAGLLAALAYDRARRGDAVGAHAAEAAALAELASIDVTALADDDRPAYADAAMRVNASRWAAATPMPAARALRVETVPGAPGETCVLLLTAKHDASAPLLRRCTYAQVWAASATLNREGNALALAVQPSAAWRELWILRRGADGWFVQVLPPAPSGPEVGYAEFAGWVPGGRQVLVARESRVDGRTRRAFEVVRLVDLATERQSGDVAALGPFQRWSDPAWKRESVALRQGA